LINALLAPTSSQSLQILKVGVTFVSKAKSRAPGLLPATIYLVSSVNQIERL
jgi:hypothetical protein